MGGQSGAAARQFFETFGREYFDFDAETGVICHRQRPLGFFPSRREYNMFASRYAGRAAGYSCAGYRYIKTGGYVIPAHHFMWWFTHGRWPADILDHIN